MGLDWCKLFFGKCLRSTASFLLPRGNAIFAAPAARLVWQMSEFGGLKYATAEDAERPKRHSHGGPWERG